MGKSNHVLEDTQETSDSENRDTQARPFQTPFWTTGSWKRKRVCGLPVWCVALGLAFSTLAIVLCAVLGTILPRRAAEPLVQTGQYPSDAPFKEVLRSNFPDPTIIRRNGNWFAYATNNAAGILDSKLYRKSGEVGRANAQIATSSNFLEWTLHGQDQDPLSVLGDWVSTAGMPSEADESTLVRQANLWAPEIIQRPDGKFVLYYSATAADTSVHCVGASISDTLDGPFEPQRDFITCPSELGGAIDPGAFIDSDGSIYLSYKVDGNSKGHGGQCNNMVPPLKNTPILLQKMEQDGITPSGSPVQILDRIDEDGPLVEAPTFARSRAGIYFLFFSSGCTRNPSYNLKYATSVNITGPYARASEPLLKTGSWGLLAPGSASVSWGDLGWHIAFHARVYTDVGGIRAMYVADLQLNGTNASLRAPS